MIVNDVWGQIRIEPEYEEIISSKEFINMKYKTQLGLNCNPNAIHTRYQHSIGTYYLACKLINICKEKFSNILKITKEDEQAIKCMALVHDIGHGCFSHVSEKYLDGTHENRTINILLDENSDIHQTITKAFGINVLKKTIGLIRMKEKIKDNYSVNINADLMLVIGKLLSGGIDIDRIDYIFRDSKHVTGELNDFSNILDSIDLENISDSLEVVFNGDSEFSIANFFNKRYELYDSLYFDNKTKILESIFGKFLEMTKFSLNWNTTEIEMNNYFRECTSNSNPVIRRYANLLVNRKIDSSFIIKELNNKSSFDFYMNRLYNAVPELKKYDKCVFESNSKISIYNKDNKIFINKDGLIQDISECSKILNSELKKEKFLVAVDLELLRKCLKLDNVVDVEINRIIENVKKATTVEIEQEKKYTFSKEKAVNPIEDFKKIADSLKLTNPKCINNIDTYYDDNNILETYRIAVRKREKNGIDEWTIKKPLNDKSSISKRDEKNFSSMEEVILFLQNEWKIPISKLSEKVTLKTKRVKYDLKYGDGLFEIVFDKTSPEFNGTKYDPSYMIECELKQGNSCGLYFIDELIKNFDFIEECIFSKKEIALAEINKDKNANPFADKRNNKPEEYEQYVKQIFIDSSILLKELKQLDKKKHEIIELKGKYGDLKKPIVVTISGTPRAGKTTCIDNLFEFLKKADLKTACLEEPAGLIYQTLKNKEEKKKLLADRVGFVEQQYDVGKTYIDKNISNNDIVLCDRGILDTFIWYDMYYQLGMISRKKYKEYLLKLKDIKEYNNQFYALFTNSDESMKRDYLSSLSLEPRTTMNSENVDRFNSSMLRMMPIIEPEIGTSKLIDTSNSDKMDSSIIVANDILDSVKKLYLKR